LFKLAEWMLLRLAGREIFEGEPPDMPDLPGSWELPGRSDFAFVP
jgi:hypothetical protein